MNASFSCFFLAGSSAELLGLLSNPHLRAYLSHINTTHNPEGFMRLAMKEPLFVEFADACMKVLHPSDQDGHSLSDEKITEIVRTAIEEGEEAV